MSKQKREPTTKTPLTPREQILVNKRIESLLAGDNKPLRELALEAGYSGATPHTATQGASRALLKPYVREYIQEKVFAATDANNHEVIALLTTHLRADIGDFPEDAFNEDGSLNIKKLKSVGLSRLIKKYETETTTNRNGEKVMKTKLELHDSQAAAKTLAPIFKMIAGPTVNVVNVIFSPEDVAWASECREKYRNQFGWTDAQIIECVPEVAEMLQLKAAE